jgi:hypothetical protein
MAASGDVDGDGRADLVLGEEASNAAADVVEVYRLSSTRTAQRIATVSAFDGAGTSGSGNLLVGDVDPQVPGDEIVVAEDGRGRRATRIRVFGGLADGALQLLWELRGVSPRFARREPMRFALGDVASSTGEAGRKLVIADPRGFVQIFGLGPAGMARLRRVRAFASDAHMSTATLAVGDIVPSMPGDEIVVADAGARGEGRVRVLDGQDGTLITEFSVFAPGTARAGVALWIGDVIDSLPGAELIVGQGATGGEVRVFSVATGVAQPLLDLPNESGRTTALARHVAIGDVVASLPGSEVIIAQEDARAPIEVFHLSEQNVRRCAVIDASTIGPRIGSLAVGR